MILPGSHSQSLSARLATATDHDLASVRYERFPDGELCASLSGSDPDALAGEHAVVVASTLTSDAHLELLQLQDAAREAGADEVTTVIPYMGYGRQDEAFKPGQPVSARAVARAVSTGTDRVLLVSPHEPDVTDFFDVPCELVEGAARLAEPLPADLDDPVFVSPDEGAIEIAEHARDAYGAGTVDYFEKDRDYDTGEVEISPGNADVAGRDVVLVDDMVATGSTMSEAVDALHDRDVGRVFVVCVHPLLVGDARTKLERAGLAGIWGTDTVERDVSAVSVAPLLADLV
ncbi:MULTISPECIES: ribose-phosphate diphosphokinase [Halolamina]|uniref:Ribose-phosphate pyrophosphokinase n=1 Tax=Halolamina pelagica TaxID=699431 RepID=A0A1I5SB01_9EURY|nr:MULTISPECIES: ribose-phosphate diphosphokinase [Halolamina]NHX37140.1 ribose-phosphate diphosphokinase [Halolamina sp. R1-12]SFP67958.1 ribose-phosphate pyrophosphokinase [Halolamina pelagica]